MAFCKVFLPTTELIKIEMLAFIYKKTLFRKFFEEKNSPYMRKMLARFSFSSMVAVSKTNLPEARFGSF